MCRSKVRIIPSTNATIESGERSWPDGSRFSSRRMTAHRQIGEREARAICPVRDIVPDLISRLPRVRVLAGVSKTIAPDSASLRYLVGLCELKLVCGYPHARSLARSFARSSSSARAREKLPRYASRSIAAGPRGPGSAREWAGG